MKTRFVATSVLETALSLSAQGGAPALDSIRQDDLRADLYFLTSDANCWVESRV